MKRLMLIFLMSGGLIPLAMGGIVLHVSTHGDDSASGKANAPFRTLERARDEIRRLKAGGALPTGGAVVEVRRGIYELDRPFALTARDSGTLEAPIIYRAEGGEVRIESGRFLKNWRHVTDAATLQRLDPLARGHVWETDLRTQGITNFIAPQPGTSWGESHPGLELFFGDRRMTLARWPNQGWIKIADVLGPTVKDIRGTKGSVEGIFSVKTDRLKRWVNAPDIMAEGFWFWDWADQRQRVESLDPAKGIIRLAKPYHSYGYRVGQWFYVYNLLCELDSPGEWYLDRNQAVLYFWPPTPLNSIKAMVSVLPTIVAMRNVANVTLQGFVLEGAQGTAVTLTDCANVALAACVIRNCGGWAARVSGGRLDHVVGCDIYQTGDGGVDLEGGGRSTLEPSGHVVENCHIHDYSQWNPVYKPAIRLSGVGNRAAHNLIHDAPHMAIGFGGNDEVIEYNEIYRVVEQSNDAGAMYAGRDWSVRGNLIRYNYLHDISGRDGRGCVGVYLDDNFSSATIFGNIFYRVTAAAFIGGGRDNLIANNIFVDCKPAIHVDARGLGWAASSRDELTRRLEQMPYRKAPWSTRYPQLLALLNDEPMAPKGNVIATNICWGGKWADIEGKAEPFLSVTDNLVQVDPKFADSRAFHSNTSGAGSQAASLDQFQLRAESPAWKLGFQKIPIEQIGLYPNVLRASWPVKPQGAGEGAELK